MFKNMLLHVYITNQTLYLDMKQYSENAHTITVVIRGNPHAICYFINQYDLGYNILIGNKDTYIKHRNYPTACRQGLFSKVFIV